MKKAIFVRVVLLAVLIVTGVFSTFIMERNKVEVYNQLNDIWSMHIQSTEDIYREKARNILEQGKYCINTILASDINKSSDFNDRLFTAIDTCMKKAKTTSTGDSFAFRTSDYMFIYDPSLDCFVDGGKKFYSKETSVNILAAIEYWDTLPHDERVASYRMLGMEIPNGELQKPEYPECYLHENPEMCFKARTALVSGYDSTFGNDVGWRFDDAEEWLEWVVLPVADKGFKGIARGDGTKKPEQVVLAIGIQSDELTGKCTTDSCFDALFNRIHEDSKLEKMLVQILLFSTVVFVLITTSIDYYYHRETECPYQSNSCPHKGE